MSNQSNSEIIKATREFRDVMTADTAIIEIAKMLSRSADRLDVTTAALREKTRQCDALAAENAQMLRLLADIQAQQFEHAEEVVRNEIASLKERSPTLRNMSSLANYFHDRAAELRKGAAV